LKGSIKSLRLDHLSEELVDLCLPVSEVSTLHEVVDLLAPSSSGVVELHGPQEVAGVLEVGSDGEDFVDKILHADDAVLAKVGFDDVIAGDGGSVSSDLDETSLVDQLTDSLQIWGSPGDLRLADPEHVESGLVQLDEHAVVDLAKTEQLESLLNLGGDLVDTTNSHDEGKLGIGGDIEVSSLLCITLKLDLRTFLILVFLSVLLGPLEDLDPLGLPGDLNLEGILSADCAVLCLALPALQKGLGHGGQFWSHFLLKILQVHI